MVGYRERNYKRYFYKQGLLSASRPLLIFYFQCFFYFLLLLHLFFKDILTGFSKIIKKIFTHRLSGISYNNLANKNALDTNNSLNFKNCSFVFIWHRSTLLCLYVTIFQYGYFSMFFLLLFTPAFVFQRYPCRVLKNHPKIIFTCTLSRFT